VRDRSRLAVYDDRMPKIRFVREVVTVVFGPVKVGDVHDAREDTAARYVSAGWAEPVPVKKAAAKRGAK